MSSLRPRGGTASNSRLPGEYEFIPCQHPRIPLVADRTSELFTAPAVQRSRIRLTEPDQGGQLPGSPPIAEILPIAANRGAGPRSKVLRGGLSSV
jgi:hypothetical protein